MVIRFPSKDSKDKSRRELAQWIEEQRQAYKNGTLSQEQINKLEQIPEWSWESTCDILDETAKE